MNAIRTWFKNAAISIGVAMMMLASACGGKTASTSSGESGAPAQSGELKLVLISPHNEFIQNEFEAAFNAEYAASHNGDTVEFEWQNRGGTGEIVKYINSTYGALGDDKDQGIGIDIVFGGGTDAFVNMKKNGNTAVADIPAEVLDAIPSALGGLPLRDTEGHWFGTALSSFGIIYNKAGLVTKAIAEPKTWLDLAAPDFMGHVVLGDPAKSSSSRVCYEVILQKYGWDEGWGSMMEIAGNTREFTSSSSQVPNDVSQGNALAGMCIDFYAYNEIEAKGADAVGYVGPANATAVTPDPIGMLRGAPHKAIAEAFISFVLSDRGQALWCLPVGATDGPTAHGLWRTPIRPTIFKQYAGKMLMDFNPFEAENPFSLDMPLSNTRDPLLGPLFSAAFLNNMSGLKKAWDAVKDLPADHPARVRFREVPFAFDQLKTIAADYVSGSRTQIQYDAQWQNLFSDRYKEVVEMAK